VKPRDSEMIENTIGLYKTELIKPRGPWRSLAEVELAIAEYVDWHNNKRLRTAIGRMPPVEHEAAYYAQTQPQPVAGPKT
jgi:putative transposase